MKKSLFFLLLLSLALAPTVQAADSDLFFGQQHNYTVTFRGNGEAFVLARVAFTNFSDSDLKSLDLATDKVIYEKMAYQQILPQTCTKWEYNQELKGSDCVAYGTGDYYKKIYSNDRNVKYEKLTVVEKDNKIHIDLKQSVKAGDQGAILLAFYSKGYVNKNFGNLFKFNFETLKAPVRINETNVAVNLDSELVMKGDLAKVNYVESSASGFDDLALGLQAGEATGLSEASTMKMNRVVADVGASGTLNRTAKNLAPNETFSVKGQYATSQFRLNLTTFVVIGLIALGLILLIVFLIVHFKRRAKTRPTNPTLTSAPTSNLESPSQKDQHLNLFKPSYILWSAISALAIFLATFTAIFVGNNLSKLIGYRYDDLVAVLGLLLLIIFYLFLLFGIPGIIASKHGARAYLSVIINTFIFCIIFLVITIIILAVLNNIVKPDYTPPYYY